MAAGIATSRHYVGHSLSCLAAIRAFPDMTGRHPKISTPAFGSVLKTVSASGCPLASQDFVPSPPLSSPRFALRRCLVRSTGCCRPIFLGFPQSLFVATKGSSHDRPSRTSLKWTAQAVDNEDSGGGFPIRTAHGAAISDPREPAPSLLRQRACRECPHTDHAAPWSRSRLPHQQS
jgi:hypothetical protein